MWGMIEEPQNRPEGSILAYLGALVWAVELVGPEMIGERAAEVLEELYLMYSLPLSPPFSIMSCVESFANFLMYSLSQPNPSLEESGEEWKEEWVEDVVDGLQAVDNQRELAEELVWGLAALLSYELEQFRIELQGDRLQGVSPSEAIARTTGDDHLWQ